MSSSSEPLVRPATLRDADEVVRLAGVMYGSMGLDAADPVWLHEARVALEARLGRDVAVFVVDDPCHADRLAASGAGSIARRLPSPFNPAALVGYVQWVATDESWRRSGFSRAILQALLAWYETNEVRVIELHTTAIGERLYRSLGFQEGPTPALRLVR
jgi:GNAT superfamily N-acetyltransferase